LKPLFLLAVAAGLVMEPFGILFLLQGLGIVRWPASSFMIDQSVWVVYGAAIAVIGFGLWFWGIRSLRRARL